jgi:hypothetical protein
MNGEVSFGVNGISKIYDETDWRPTHYVRAEEASTYHDASLYKDDLQLHMDLGCTIWANEFFQREVDGLRKSGQYHQIRGCAHYSLHFDDENCPHVYHPPRLCTFGSSVNVAIQIAIDKLGADEVYLVGCDLGYIDGGQNHFNSEYTKGVGELRNARLTELDILTAHVICARSYPRKIKNATKGGSLEVYERVDYDELF